MWVYVRVFGVAQWTIILILMIAFVTALTIVSTWSTGQNNGSLKENAFNAFGSTYLFIIQKGEHPESRHFGSRLLTVTVAFFTLLVFVYYINEIMAEMTAGPPEIPIKTFEDVIHHKYRVIAGNPYSVRHLARAESGSAKRKVHQINFVDQSGRQENDQDSIQEIMSQPKTLLYSQRVLVIPEEKLVTGQIYALNMDDSAYSLISLGLQKDSEFLGIVNYNILKAIEHGFWSREHREFHIRLHVNQQVGMREPQPLAYHNVMFVFICLLMGIVISMTLAMTEKVQQLLSRRSSPHVGFGRHENRSEHAWGRQRSFQKARESMIKKIIFG